MRVLAAGLALAMIAGPVQAADRPGSGRSDAPRSPAARHVRSAHVSRPLETTSPSSMSTSGTSPSPFAADRSTYAPRYTSPPARPWLDLARRGLWASGAYGFVGYGAPAADSSGAQTATVPDASDLAGILYLEVDPATAQVVVDSSPVGMVGEFVRAGVTLPVGPHRIELRASGYEAQSFDVNIVAGQPVRYRGGLPPVRRPAVDRPTLAAPRPPETFYVIPGCYAGDRLPRASSLPAGCDISRVRTIGAPN